MIIVGVDKLRILFDAREMQCVKSTHKGEKPYSDQSINAQNIWREHNYLLELFASNMLVGCS